MLGQRRAGLRVATIVVGDGAPRGGVQHRPRGHRAGAGAGHREAARRRPSSPPTTSPTATPRPREGTPDQHRGHPRARVRRRARGPRARRRRRSADFTCAGRRAQQHGRLVPGRGRRRRRRSSGTSPRTATQVVVAEQGLSIRTLPLDFGVLSDDTLALRIELEPADRRHRGARPHPHPRGRPGERRAAHRPPPVRQGRCSTPSCAWRSATSGCSPTTRPEPRASDGVGAELAGADADGVRPG